MIAFHKARGITEPWRDLVTFFRYFPLGTVNPDKSVNIRYRKKAIKFFYGPQGPITAGEFARFDYADLPVKNKTVIDIGVAIGDTPIIFCLEGADRVVGYDINRRYLDIARKNVEANHLAEKIDLYYCAIASSKVMPTDEILGALMLEEDRGLVGNADFATLEQITRAIPAHEGVVLKMDVDGYEYEILNSASAKVLNQFEHIALEYHFGTQNLPKLLELAGFSVTIREVTKCVVEHHPTPFRNMDIGIINARRTRII
jgi:FkbM family methyltransferase